jgi:uncharacterized membrane protein YkvA (DUF1232 family)
MLKQLQDKAKKLKKEIAALYYAYQHPQLHLMPKIIILFTLGYSMSPIDLIPDFIPVLGYLDDLIIIPALISISIKLIPAEIIEESRKRAEQEPLELKKYWPFACIFILIWLLLASVIVSIIRKP